MAAIDVYRDSGFPERPHITSLRDVSASEFITAYSQHLKKSGRLELPEWVDYVKTGRSREMPPIDPDWYYVRAASIVRKIYLNAGLGIGALAHWYGKADSTGRRQHHRRASRKILRHILIGLEHQGIVEKLEDGGRRVTPEGQRDLDTVARAVVTTA